jgi:hypothetical protein
VYDCDGYGYVHCVALASHGQDRSDPLAQGPRTFRTGVELPGETAKPSTAEHKADCRVTSPTGPSHVFWRHVFFVAVYVPNFDVSCRTAERANARAWRSALG